MLHRLLDPNDYARVYNDSFVKRYLTALIKRQWGQNLIKFQGVKLPGGVELNGRQIYDDAERKLDKIKEVMSNTYELPPFDMIVMLNPFFTQGTRSEQNLVQDLINEQLRMYGVDIYYIPRKYVKEKTVIKEVVQSKFDNALPIEAYVDNYDAYSGAGDVLSKFGIESKDEVRLIISRERYENYITPLIQGQSNIKLSTRPKRWRLDLVPFR